MSAGLRMGLCFGILEVRRNAGNGPGGTCIKPPDQYESLTYLTTLDGEHGPAGLTDRGHEQPAEASWLQVLSARVDEETTDQRVKRVVVRLDPLLRRLPVFRLWSMEGP